MSSFTEAVCHLFDDSGLEASLFGREGAFTWAIDGRLRLLADSLKQVPEDAPVADVLASPAMSTVRTLAAAILRDLEALP